MLDESSASHALLSAALGGLLCVAACAPKATTQTSSDAAATADAGDEASAEPFECDGGVVADAGVTSSQMVPSLTLDDFTSQCDAQHGVVEISPHCGGSNNCRGFTYDTGTQLLTQHTCRATNACAGYSCIICD